MKKVLGYIEIQEGRISSGGNSDESMEDLSAPYGQLKEAVSENVDRFFGWSVTDEKESEVTETAYYFLSESGKTEIEKATYDQLKREGANVTTEAWPTNAKMVEYTIALMQNSQLSGSGSGFEYKYVTDQGTFELVIKVLKVLQDGVQALKDSFFSLFSWTDFVTGGSSTDSYIGNIDATGDIITYNTVGKGVKQVVYYNQVEEPWGSMPYGTSTIGAAGCGPTSLAIVISTLTKQTVTPQMTAAYAISNGEYVSGVGTAHSFPTNAANH